jgi:hypothetical protein
MRVAAEVLHALVASRGSSGRDHASNVAARVPRVPGVHAQHI